MVCVEKGGGARWEPTWGLWAANVDPSESGGLRHRQGWRQAQRHAPGLRCGDQSVCIVLSDVHWPYCPRDGCPTESCQVSHLYRGNATNGEYFTVCLSLSRADYCTCCYVEIKVLRRFDLIWSGLWKGNCYHNVSTSCFSSWRCHQPVG